MTGVSSQRPRPVRARRIETYIQPARASITGGHTQLRVERVASCGEKSTRAAPAAAIATAGTAGPVLGMSGHRGGEDAHHRPAEPEAQEGGSGDDALCGAGEDDQDEEQGRHGSGDNEPTMTRDTGTGGERMWLAVPATLGGGGVDAHGALALAVGGGALR
jgi:hypothetical protein